MNARFFIRDDDVWRLDRAFRFFFDLVLEREIPVVYAVIPGKMDRELVRFLCRQKDKNPHLLDIVQHGYTHADHGKNTGVKYEFGALRSMSQQRKDIHEGLIRMREGFAGHFTPAFVPPYHGYDERTLRILEQEGFEILSAGANRVKLKRGFLEVPTRVSFSRYALNQKIILSAAEILGHLARDVQRFHLSGVLIHHSDFSEKQSQKELGRFFDGISVLKTEKGWKAMLFSEIISALKGSNRN